MSGAEVAGSAGVGLGGRKSRKSASSFLTSTDRQRPVNPLTSPPSVPSSPSPPSDRTARLHPGESLCRLVLRGSHGALHAVVARPRCWHAPTATSPLARWLLLSLLLGRAGRVSSPACERAPARAIAAREMLRAGADFGCFCHLPAPLLAHPPPLCASSTSWPPRSLRPRSSRPLS